MSSFYSIPPKPEDIFHYGVKGKSGRYPWGSGGRPYQRLEGTRGRGLIGRLQEKKRRKQEAAMSAAAEKAIEAIRNEAEEKERILREGSATDVMALRGKITNQELQQAVNRLNLESQLKSLSDKEFKSNMDKIDDIMKGIKTGTEWGKIGIETYNTIANIYNATDEGQKKPMRLVGGGGGKKKKKQGDDD